MKNEIFHQEKEQTIPAGRVRAVRDPEQDQPRRYGDRSDREGRGWCDRRQAIDDQEVEVDIAMVNSVEAALRLIKETENSCS